MAPVRRKLRVRVARELFAGRQLCRAWALLSALLSAACWAAGGRGALDPCAPRRHPPGPGRYKAADIDGTLTAGALGNGTAADEAATEGGLGVSVLSAGLLAFVLAATQFTDCCHTECCAQLSYV